MSELDRDQFEAWMRRLGLDPADHDVAELHGAWLRLEKLLARLEDADRPADAEMLASFDPARRI